MRDQIIQKVVKALNSVYSKLKGVDAGRRKWTDAVLTELCQACKDECFDGLLCCPDPEDLNPAWLYDMVWYRMESRCLAETPLVLESEWSTRMDDVRYDLEKLLVAKASVKVMIVDAGCGDCETMMANEIRTFKGHSAEERYLLAQWTAKKFEYTVFNGVGEILDANNWI